MDKKEGHYYFALDPIKSEYKDSNTKKPLIKISIDTKEKQCSICFYGEKEEIDFIKIIIPDCEDETFDDKSLDLIQVLKEHALSVLRTTYDSTTSFYPISFWTFKDTKRKFNMCLSFSEHKNLNFKINKENIQNVFISTYSSRNELKLLSDSMDKRIPLQYRYLSLYKIIELNFKNDKGKLDTKRLDAFLDKFEEKNLRGKIIGLRDKCVHIHDNKGVMGVTQLNRTQIIEVEEFIPLFQKIVITFVNEKSNGKFTIYDGSSGNK